MKAYIASPLFNEHQIDHIMKIEDYCDKVDLSYFSPRNGKASKEYFKIPEDNKFEINLSKSVIFASNIFNIDDSDIVFVNIEGFDSGTLFELGYALAKDKYVVCSNPEDKYQVEFKNIISDFLHGVDKLNYYKIKSIRGVFISCNGNTFNPLGINSDDGIIVRAENDRDSYKGFSKILLGYLYGMKYRKLSYVDIHRKSNLMLSCSVNVYEVEDNSDNTKYIPLNNLKLVVGEKDE